MEVKQQEAEQEQAQSEISKVEEPQDTTNWKEEARKWEKYAKQNKAAADELEKIKAERMTETEKLQARAEKAEAELASISAENERVEAAKEVSKATDVPLELLMFCSNKEQMEQFADLFSQSTHVSAAPQRQNTRIVRSDDTPVSTRDVFAEMMNNVF